MLEFILKRFKKDDVTEVKVEIKADAIEKIKTDEEFLSEIEDEFLRRKLKEWMSTNVLRRYTCEVTGEPLHRMYIGGHRSDAYSYGYWQAIEHLVEFVLQGDLPEWGRDEEEYQRQKEQANG